MCLHSDIGDHDNDEAMAVNFHIMLLQLLVMLAAEDQVMSAKVAFYYTLTYVHKINFRRAFSCLLNCYKIMCVCHNPIGYWYA